MWWLKNIDSGGREKLEGNERSQTPKYGTSLVLKGTEN